MNLSTTQESNISNQVMSGASRPTPMKFFAAWGIDKTPSNCIPRLCTITINRIMLFKSLGSDLKTAMIALKIQGSKRTIRSNEFLITGHHQQALTIEIDLTFSLQYPHFLKKNVNFLQIMLQRRKRYKSRKILGFKTLAVGVINMAEVMQRRQKMDKELDLVCEMKGSHNKSEVVARIVMSSLKCQPIDQDNINRPIRFVGDRSVGGDVDTDDFSSNEEGSESEMPIGKARAINDRGRSDHVVGQSSASNTAGGASQQKNFKQKIIALVKKFRTDSDGFDNEQYEAALEQELMQAAGQGSLAIEELLEEDDLDVDDSESDPEWDEMSVSSTPKPSLRPFFSSTTLNRI